MLKTLGSIVCVTVLAGQETRRVVTLQDLRVPAERLPAGCAVAQMPSHNDAPKSSARTWFGPLAPSNPWTGADPQILSRIRESLEGATAVPDAPPPTSREFARMRLQLAEGVEEGYVAIYQQSGGSQLTVVQAVRFASDDLAQRSGPIRRTPNPRRVWLSAGRIRGVVTGDGGACFQAVSAFVSSLSQ
jgi:hypothetical protein